LRSAAGVQADQLQRRDGQRLGYLGRVDAHLDQPLLSSHRGARRIEDSFEHGVKRAVHHDLLTVDCRFDLLRFDRGAGGVDVVIGPQLNSGAGSLRLGLHRCLQLRVDAHHTDVVRR